MSAYPVLITFYLLLTTFGIANYFDTFFSNQLDLAEASESESSWAGGQSIPDPRTEMSAISSGNKLYIIGGDDESEEVTNVVQVYDPTTNKWQKGKPLPGPRGALTADFINGTLYAIGGVNASHSPVATNEAYDPKTNTWTEKAPMPTARHHHTSAEVDGKLYVIGGRLLGNGVPSEINEALSNLNDNEMYNPLNDSWTAMEQMPTKRSGIAAAASPVDGNIYVFGGQSVDGAFGNNEKYNPKMNKWSTEESMPTARLGLEAIALENKIYVIGGKTDLGPYVSDKNEIFSINI